MKVSPFYEVVTHAEEVIKKGGTVYQQFNCAGCGAKQTMDDPNKFYKLGLCQECGHETNIERDGCNFMAVHKYPKGLGNGPEEQR